MARKNKGNAEHENHERWLITYADLITLLLIFFVIMYSMSKIDIAKYTELSKALSFQFKKSDTIIPSGTVGIADPGQGVDGNEASKDPDKEDPSKQEQTSAQQQTQADKEKQKAMLEQELLQKEQQLQDLLKKIKQYIADNKLQTLVTVNDTNRGIAITLNDLFLFDSGKADLKPASFPILTKLATLFPTLKTTISIEGHTDNQPLNTGSIYKDNDGLSAGRSLSVKRYFDNSPALHGMLIGTYYGDTRPVAPNDTPENMQKNRRVEIIVLREAQAAATVTAAAK
jgi:chemotaxis protein MotB